MCHLLRMLIFVPWPWDDHGDISIFFGGITKAVDESQWWFDSHELETGMGFR